MSRTIKRRLGVQGGALSTRLGRSHIGKPSCLSGSICFRLFCICMALAERPSQSYCTCSKFRCTCINFAVVEDSGEPPYYTPPQQMEILEAWNAGVYGCWGIWMLVYMALWHGWQDMYRSQQRCGAASPLPLSTRILPTIPQSHIHQHPYTPASIYPSIPSL